MEKGSGVQIQVIGCTERSGTGDGEFKDQQEGWAHRRWLGMREDLRGCDDINEHHGSPAGMGRGSTVSNKDPLGSNVEDELEQKDKHRISRIDQERIAKV